MAILVKTMLKRRAFLAAAFLLLLSNILLASHGEPYTYENSEKYFHLIKWQNYSQQTFDLAARENKPVMLVISAVWCYWCHVYESPDYLYNENVYPYINENFVPVFIDSDKRPDLTRQYLEGGWPSTTFFTPEKERIAGYSGPLPLNQLVPSFEKVVVYNKNRKSTEKPAVAMAPIISRNVEIPTRENLVGIQNNYLQSTMSYIDPVYGGFGGGQKFPQGLTEDFMLTSYESTNGSQLLSAVKLTADLQETKNLSDYRLSDPIEGGYHRYGTTRTWSPPHYEKMLYDNARQLVMLSHLYEITGDSHYSELAYSTWEYVDFHFGRSSAGFAGSQDAAEDYYQLGLEGRSQRIAPAIDESRYSDWNGEMFYALFAASNNLENDSIKNEAAIRLKALLGKVSSDRGVLHYYSIEKDAASLDGQLNDNAFMLLAAVRAYEETGDAYFLGQAKKIADYSLQNLYDWSSAGFFERHSTDIELYTNTELLSTSKPAFGNGAMALAMLKLYNATRNPVYLDVGLKTISEQNGVPQLDDGYYLVVASKYAVDNSLAETYAALEPRISKMEGSYRNDFFLYAGLGNESRNSALRKPDFSSIAASNLPTTNFFIILLIALVAGLLSFLSPCCFSLLPAYFAHTIKSKEKILLNGIGFFIGLGLLLSFIGGAAALFGSFAVAHEKQLLGQAAGVVMLILGVMTILGRGFSGLKIDSKATPSTFHGSVAFGALFGLGWSPCIGPILLALFALAANSSTIFQGMLLLLAYSAGLSLPLILLSLYIEKINKKGLLWRLIKGRGFTVAVFGREFYLHSTSVLSGLLMVALGSLMATGYLYAFNSLTPAWLQKLENDLLGFFT